MNRYTLCVMRYVLIAVFIFSSLGCEAFVRKFTRKKKKDAMPQEEIVLAPEEWKGAQMTKEQIYRQYFLFWKAWQDELIDALQQRRSQKKQIDCSLEAIKNLISLRPLLNEDTQKTLDKYINQLKDLRDALGRDFYGGNIAANVNKAERIKRNILRDFSYNKIKNNLL